MKKPVLWLALLLYAGQFLAPAFIVTAFFAERSRIERELCVQRARAEGMRTCHGECHLMKQLKAAEDAAADHSLPQLPGRTQPEWCSHTPVLVPVPPVHDKQFAAVHAAVHQRPFEPLEHVPWC
ncbi:MAG: hypothetical protein IPJ76_02610 [Flavobacteriales bacterium]|nr:MAG: hypothetical protein IPJ76_02610 [Flavobacteriales bacterium]